jgi:hypothetical protein
MSSFIVVEALGLVTWWALGRLVHALKPGGRRYGGDGAGTGADAGEGAPLTAAEEDPVGSA